MSGLEKIAAEIKQEAQQKADDILAQAKAKVKTIADAAAAEQAKYKEQYAERTQKETQQIAERFASDNRQQRKQALLKTRSQVIEGVIGEAKQKIEALPDNEYVDLMQAICVRNAQAGEGKLYFAKADMGRMPDGFADKCNAEIKNGSVVVAGTVDTIKNGFFDRLWQNRAKLFYR
ncbi:V-type ATP synthase subunit E [Christensenellaceae bacterium OttesenSCG-928-K19]|nr:V-type ATP synthase subunit E [Christensenellaceae bacterium OttesenSCG-928-K19]